MPTEKVNPALREGNWSVYETLSYARTHSVYFANRYRNIPEPVADIRQLQSLRQEAVGGRLRHLLE